LAVCNITVQRKENETGKKNVIRTTATITTLIPLNSQGRRGFLEHDGLSAKK